MKRYLLIIAVVLLAASCRKNLQAPPSPVHAFPDVLKATLKDSLSPVDFGRLELGRAVATRFDKSEMILLRIPLSGHPPLKSFALLHITEGFQLIRGRIIELEGNDDSRASRAGYPGKVSIYSLSRTPVLSSPVHDGYITAFYPQVLHRTGDLAIVPSPVKVLPEVIVVSNYPPDGDMSWSTWINLLSLMGVHGSGYYSDLDSHEGENPSPDGSDGSADNSSGEMNTGNGSITWVPPWRIDYEYVEDHPAIDVKKYINCFSQIPDSGADCSIEIFTDIPVDGHPEILFDWQNQSPGHTFIRLSKCNDSQSIDQYIGFYPKRNWKAILAPDPTDAKFADNGQHEYNASFSMSLTPVQLQEILYFVEYLARAKSYDIDEYNCTDWALQVFNFMRREELQIPKYPIPGGDTPAGTNTPQGLYRKLVWMKNGNHPEAANITITTGKKWAGNSKGPCN